MVRVGSMVALSLGLTVVVPGSVYSSPVIYCSSKSEGHYVNIKEYDRGLRIYETVENAWSVELQSQNLLFAHCPSGALLRIDPNEDSQSYSWARGTLVEKIADSERESFGEVASYFSAWGYDVALEKLPDDGCICKEQN